MADVSERLSDTQEKPEASDVQVITHNNNNNNNKKKKKKKKKRKKKKKKKKKKRKYYCVSSTSDSWSNDSDCQQFDKRQKTKKKNRGSNAEQKQGNRKKKKDSRQLSCNSHCSFDQAMRVEETLMWTLACQLSSSFDPGLTLNNIEPLPAGQLLNFHFYPYSLSVWSRRLNASYL